MILVVLFFGAGIVLAAGVAFYWQYIDHLLEKDIIANIHTASQETAEAFTQAIQADQRIVDTIAITVQTNYPWRKPEELKRFLHLQVKYNEFENLGVIPLKGDVILAHPAELDKTWLKEILTEALEGDNYISARQTDPASGKSVFVQAASLHEGMKPVGALFALLPTQRYQPFLTFPATADQGVAFVVSQKGDVQASGRELSPENVFTSLAQAKFDKRNSWEKVRTKIQTAAPAFVRYQLSGKNRLLYGMPLPLNRWYLLSVVSTDSIRAQAQHLTWVSLGLFVFIFILFGLLAFYMFHLRAYSNRQLFQTAFIDPLTGADNLNRMMEIFPKHLSGLQGNAALVLFDILKFKVINDMLGYERGNLVLQQVAQLLWKKLAKNERFCRSAADNFVLLLNFTDRRELRQRLAQLLSDIRRDCTVSESCIMVEGACGVYEITETVPFYIAMDRAHLALENAKRASTEAIQFYDEKYRRRILTERQLENSMEQALADGSFELVLQPKFDFHTQKMQGAEALVRWNLSDRGLVRPDDFIPLFEKNGFILKLDMFILEKVVQLLAKWRQEGKQHVPVAVNFSRLHLNDSRYIPQMSRTVDTYHVPRRLIEVELTESVILNNRELAQNVIRGLHNKGFSVAMDDFGSGYSSLNVLKSLQFDSIKLDKEFLNGCEQDPTARKVIRGAVEMIKSIGAKVIAEGVETAEQAEFLQAIGCDLAQGYYFSRPLPVEEFEKLLKPFSPRSGFHSRHRG